MLKGKDDTIGAEQLKKKSKEEIIASARDLLKFLQDINWPVSGAVGEVLSTHLDEIADPVIEVLRSDDQEWKYSVLLLLLKTPRKRPPAKILYCLTEMVKSPTIGEVNSHVTEECNEVLAKWQ